MESGTQYIPQVGTYRVVDYIHPSHKTIVTILRILYTVVYGKLCTEVLPVYCTIHTSHNIDLCT